MQDRIEPPVLLSRLMMFVFAGTVVVLFVMLMTLEKMFPLNRPEVFFVTTKPDNASVIQINEMPPDSESLEEFKQAFIMEYIRARNEVEKNTSIMRQRWVNPDGIMATWSTPEVYLAFKKTGLYNAISKDFPDFEFTCPVAFRGRPLPIDRNKTKFSVKIEYYCTDNSGQTNKKIYTIRIGLDMHVGATVQWRERLNNPLGIMVSEYSVEGGEDPLDTVYKQ